MPAPWTLSGTYFEACNCEAACPCVFTSPPSEGQCTAVVAWHIEKGNLGDVTLDGLNVALAVHSPGHMLQTKWKVAAYFDERANPAQSDALHAIFGGKAGGHPATLASFIGEIVGAKSVPIQFQAGGKNASLTIAGIVDLEIETSEGQGGQPITIENHPLCIAPGKPATLARSKHLRFTDLGMKWEISGRNGFISDFAYSA